MRSIIIIAIGKGQDLVIVNIVILRSIILLPHLPTDPELIVVIITHRESTNLIRNTVRKIVLEGNIIIDTLVMILIIHVLDLDLIIKGGKTNLNERIILENHRRTKINCKNKRSNRKEILITKLINH